MYRTEYVQSVVRTRLLEKELLSHVKFEQMVEASDVDEIWRILHTTSYAKLLQDKYYANEEFEYFLIDVLQREYKHVYDLVHEAEYIQVLQLKYDYYNAKVLIKENLLGDDLTNLYLPLGTISIEQLKSGFEQEISDITNRLAEAIEETLFDYENYKDPQRIEILLDRRYLEHLYDKINLLNIPLFENYFQAKVDFLNLLTLLRVRKQQRNLDFLEEVLLPYGSIEREKLMYSLNDSTRQLIRNYEHETIGTFLKRALEDYEQTGSIHSLEKEMDHYLLQIIDDAKYIHFGPEPLMAYILKKEAEIKNLRIVFMSKLNKISVENINQRMRDVYV